MPDPLADALSALAASKSAQAHAEGIADALQVSELRYRRLFETARDGILLLDPGTGRITDANPYMTELLGYSHDELLGKELWEIGLLRDKAASQEAFQRLDRDGYIRYEDLPLENRDGERREVEFVSNLYPENGHTVIQCNIRDITERKRGEHAFRESEERLRLATEGAGVGVWKLIPATNSLTWTARCCEIFGLPTDGSMSAPGELPWTLIHPEDVGGVRAAMERTARESSDFRYEYRVLTPSGETRWVQSRGRPYQDGEGRYVRVEGVLSDVTEGKRVEAELAAAAARNERIAETLQRSMLQTPSTDRLPGIAVETLYESALNEARVGGDFFDAFALSGERIALVVGDVSGKGLAAAERTAEVKYALRSFLHAHQAPDVALTHLNGFLWQTHSLDKDGAEAFIVLALAVVDTATGDTTFSSAGAEPTLILRLDGTAEAVEITGMPLGVYSASAYAARTTRLASGETIVMATDGITEARRGREFLGTEGVAALVVEAGPTAPVRELVQAIHDGARAFAGGGLHDDVCLLAARRM